MSTVAYHRRSDIAVRYPHDGRHGVVSALLTEDLAAPTLGAYRRSIHTARRLTVVFTALLTSRPFIHSYSQSLSQFTARTVHTTYVDGEQNVGRRDAKYHQRQRSHTLARSLAHSAARHVCTTAASGSIAGNGPAGLASRRARLA